ncbi:MAG: protein kinase [Gammaproteobacteria bacterium]|nr:protein kinase [Gammaproteobacteria bacterium]
MPNTLGNKEKNCQELPIEIPIIPPKVDLSDLTGFDGMRLIDEKETARIKILLKNNGYFTKRHVLLSHSTLNTPISKWSYLRLKNKIFSFYHGSIHGKELGKGSFGKVILAQDHETGKWFAAKKEMKLIKSQEINILKRLGRLSCDTIPENINNLINSEKEKTSEQNNTFSKHLTIMEYYAGVSLTKFIKTNTLTLDQLLTIFQNMAIEVQNILSRGILHRDIKPDNFIIDPVTLKVTLIDFNLSILAQKEQRIYNFKSPHFAGTEGFTGIIKDQNNNYIFSEKSEGFALVSSFLYLLNKQKNLSPCVSLFAKTPLEKALSLEDKTPLVILKDTKNLIIPEDVLEARSLFIEEILDSIKTAKENIPPSSELAINYAYIHVKDYAKIIQDKKLLEELAQKKEVFLTGKISDKKELREKQINYCSKVLHALVNAGVKIQNKIYPSPTDLMIKAKQAISDDKLLKEKPINLSTIKEIRTLISSEIKRLRPKLYSAENTNKRKIFNDAKKRKILKERHLQLRQFFCKSRPFRGVTIKPLLVELKELRDQMKPTCTFFKSWRTSTSYDTLQKLISHLENKYKINVARQVPTRFIKIR